MCFWFDLRITFHLVAEGLAVCPFCGSFFVWFIGLPLQFFQVIRPIFDDIVNRHWLIVTTIARCFLPLTAKCNRIYCQTAWKNPTRATYGVHFSAILNNYNGNYNVHLSSVYTDYNFSSCTSIDISLSFPC